MRTVRPFRAPTAYEEEMLKAQRQQQLAEMLRQQAEAPEQEYSYQGIRAMPSIAGGLAKVLKSYNARKAEERADEAARAAREADVAGAEEVLRGLAPQARVAAPTAEEIGRGVGMPQISEEGTVSYAPSVQPQMRTEMVGPTAQERRDFLTQTMVRGTPTAKQLAQVLAAQEPKTTVTEFGNQLLNVTGDTATPITMGGKPVTAAPKPAELPSDVQSYQYYVQQETASGRPAKTFEQWKAGQKSPPFSINLGDKGSLLGQELYLKKIDSLEAPARNAGRILNQVNAMDKATQKGTYTGSMAPSAAGAAQFLDSFGIKVKPEILANTRTFQAASNQLVLDFMAANGGARGFTEKETAILQDAFPKIIDSPQARQQIADLLRNRALQDVEDYNFAVGEFRKTFPKVVMPYKPIDNEEIRYQRWKRSQGGG